MTFDNGGFEMNNSDITTNAGGYTLAGAGDIALNSGSITSRDKIFLQTRGATAVPVTVTVGIGMVLDVICDTAAISPKSGTNPVVTINDDGVEYETGMELKADATAVVVIDREKTNGIIEIDGVKYFYRNGTAVAAGLITVDGKVYYAGTNGEILTSCTYNAEKMDNSAKHLGRGIYTFGSDGALLWEAPSRFIPSKATPATELPGILKMNVSGFWITTRFMPLPSKIWELHKQGWYVTRAAYAPSDEMSWGTTTATPFLPLRELPENTGFPR